MISKCLLWAAIVIAFVPAASSQLSPFVLPWDDATPGVTHAGARLGFASTPLQPITIGADGHLYAGENRIRFLGCNLTFGACLPTHEQSEKIAARMAKFGINCVRFHHMDWNAYPGGLMLEGAADTRNLDSRSLDRLDYLISQLKAHGIYTNLNLLVSRQFKANDGLPAEIESMDWKTRHVVGFFDDAALELQKEYARKLLTHVNSYTGKAYTAEPAVAMVEINNENGLIHAWLGGEIDAMPDVFRAGLRQQWNAWLAVRYESTEALASAWGMVNEPTGAEMLANADFSNQLASWVLERHETAEASATVETHPVDGRNVLKIVVTNPSTASWHVQLNQPGLSLEDGQIYTLVFRAKANAPRSMSVSAMQAHDPWQAIGLSASVQLDTEYRDFQMTFFVDSTDANGRVNFGGMGASTGTFWLGDLSLRPGGNAGLGAGETLEAGTIPLLNRVSERTLTAKAKRDFMRFLWETENAYWQAMYRYLKDDLSVACPVLGTIVSTSTPNLMGALDIVDGHSYWKHPVFPNNPWDPVDWFVENESMVNRNGGTLSGLALQRVAGKPFTVTEYNHAAPNTYSSEAPLLLAAYAALQDWDGIFLFAYSHRTNDWDTRRIMSFFDIDQHPTKMANLVPAAMLFLRGDIAPARDRVDVSLPSETELDLLAERGSAWNLVNASHLGVPGEAALVNRLAMTISDGTGAGSLPSLPDVSGPVYASDTGELAWDLSRAGKGVVTVNTPRTKAVIGFVDGRGFNLGGVVITPGATLQDWCTIALTLMEGDSFNGAGKALLVLTGSAENTDMGWNEDHTSVGNQWGSSPSRVEVVSATVELPLPPGRVQVWSLDEQGQRKTQLSVSEHEEKALVIVEPSSGTLWYEVVLSNSNAQGIRLY